MPLAVVGGTYVFRSYWSDYYILSYNTLDSITGLSDQIIQTDVGNQYSPTTIIAPFTKQYTSGDTYPFEGEVLALYTTLNHDSVADLSQIRVVDIDERVKKNIGSIPSSDIAKIDSALKDSLGI